MTRHDMRQLMVAGLMVLSACWAWADGMVMKNFTIDVVLQADGSARITEVWDVQMNTDKYGELFNSYDSDYFGRICDIAVSGHSRTSRQESGSLRSRVHR